MVLRVVLDACLRRRPHPNWTSMRSWRLLAPTALAALWLTPAALPARTAAPEPARAPPPALADTGEVITVCVLEQGEIREISATVDSATRDTLVGGRPFAEVHPATSPPYAEGADWFVRMEPVSVGKGPYRMKTRYGLERILGPGDLRRVGEHRGIPMFAERQDSPASPAIVYFMVRPGCVFQPYQAAYEVGGVRG
jgi:hypothetical protein